MTQEQVTLVAAIIAAIVSIFALIVTIVGWFVTQQRENQARRHQWKIERYTEILSHLRPYIVPWEHTSDAVALSTVKSMNTANLMASKKVLDRLFELGVAATRASHLSEEAERKKYQQSLYEAGGRMNELIREMRADLEASRAKEFERYRFPLLNPPGDSK